MFEYNPSYANSVATNEFYFIDTSSHANKFRFLTRQVQHGRNDANNGWNPRVFIENLNNNFNEGFFKRKELIGPSSTANCEIPLNRYSFFESLENKLLPSSKIELDIEIESDNNLIWRKGGDICKIIITKLQLFVPKIIFNSEGLTTKKSSSHLNEYLVNSSNLNQKEGNFRITNSISKPSHVFIFIVNTIKNDSQTENPFLYNTFNVANIHQLKRCHLKSK